MRTREKKRINIRRKSYSLVIRRRLKLRIHALHSLDQQMPLLLQLFARTKFARIQSLTVRTVNRFRWWWSPTNSQHFFFRLVETDTSLQVFGVIEKENETKKRKRKKENIISRFFPEQIAPSAHLGHNRFFVWHCVRLGMSGNEIVCINLVCFSIFGLVCTCGISLKNKRL
jgi:hypothetical protein